MPLPDTHNVTSREANEGDRAPRREGPPRMSFKPPSYRPRVPPPPLFPEQAAQEPTRAASSETLAPSDAGPRGRGRRPPPSYATRRQGSARAADQGNRQQRSQVLQAVMQEKTSWETQERPLLEQQVWLIFFT